MAETVEKKITEVKARLGDLHMSPRKVRLVANAVKGKTVTQARTMLAFMVKKAAKPILKLLNSASANASHNFQLQPDSMKIKSLVVNQGRVMRRFMPRAQGRAFPVKKRQSIVELVLSSDNPAKQAISKPAKARKADKVEPAADVKDEASLDLKNSEPVKNKYGRAESKKIQSKKEGSFKRRIFNRKTGV